MVCGGVEHNGGEIIFCGKTMIRGGEAGRGRGGPGMIDSMVIG